MGGGGGAKKPKKQDPQAIPVVEPVDEDAVKAALRKSSWKKAFITGALSPKGSNKRTALG